MATIDDLLRGDSDTATRIAVSIVPGFVAEMDELAGAVAAGSSRRTVLLSYSVAVDGAAQRLTTLPAKDPDTAERAATGYSLLRYNSAELLWTAPTVDGTGVLTALVDRFRVLVGGLARPPRRCSSLDRVVFSRVVEMLAEIEFERRVDEPLKRAMATLALTSGDVAKAMGVTRQAVDKWLRSGIPPERIDSIGALAEIADILRHRLRVGMPAVVARRPADAYAGRSMLEMITDGEHSELLESVRASFDYARVA